VFFTEKKTLIITHKLLGRTFVSKMKAIQGRAGYCITNFFIL
jgi:hypothetical protein